MAYEYGAKEPEKLKIKDMTPKQEELLIKSDNFCMLPWMHLHAYPDGRAYPCCFAFDPYPVGDLNKNSMEEVFNGEKMKIIGLVPFKNEEWIFATCLASLRSVCDEIICIDDVNLDFIIDYLN